MCVCVCMSVWREVEAVHVWGFKCACVRVCGFIGVGSLHVYGVVCVVLCVCVSTQAYV